MEVEVHLDGIYVPSEDVVVREIEGKLVIASLVTGREYLKRVFFDRGDIGKAVWDRLDGERSLRDVVEELSRKSEASAGEIEAHVIRFVQALIRRRMLIEI